jgi:hypothetical protein
MNESPSRPPTRLTLTYTSSGRLIVLGLTIRLLSVRRSPCSAHSLILEIRMHLC